MPVAQQKLTDFIERRLPRREMLSVADVATAVDVSSDVVYGWIDEGRIDGLNIGSRKRPRYRVLRSSVLAYLAGRGL